MQYMQALTKIHALPRISSLEAMRAFAERLGNPQEQLQTVHIAGTNGKGSTAALTASMLRAAGYRTGLFVSPFILNFRERIQIDGEMIPEDSLAALTEELLAQGVDGVGEFAFLTALAFTYFARAQCDVCVIEVGLGGRLDATNILARPLVSVITRIGLDHTELLGDTIERITREKCGILKSGVPVVTCPDQPADALAVIYEQAASSGAGEVLQPNRAATTHLTLDLTGAAFDYDGVHFALPLLGAHQVNNALTAYSIVKLLAQRGFVRIIQDAIEHGIAGVQFPARLELLQEQPPVLIDGAHNPQGMQAVADALALLGDRPVTAVVGMLADKDSRASLTALLPHLRRVCCVTPQSPRALPAEALAAQIGASAQAYDTLAQAMVEGCAYAEREQGALLICGSLYLASEARAIWFAGQGQ